VAKKKQKRERAVLTEAKARAYLTGKSARCPFCGSEDIDAEGWDADGGQEVRNPVHCNDCDSTWRDVYRLAALEVLDEDDEVVQGFDAPAPGVLIEISDGQLSYVNADGDVELVTVDWDAVEEETNPKTLQALIADVEALPPGCDEDGVILKTLQGRLAKLRAGKGA
jgi:hypothetical protein